MARHFKEVWQDAGVDEDATHSQNAATWMMVPHKGTNYVYLVDGKGLTWASDPKKKVEIREIKPLDRTIEKLTVAGIKSLSVSEALARAPQKSARLLAVAGKVQGPTEIPLMSGRNIQDTLLIDVVPRLDIKPRFHFLKVKNGKEYTRLSQSWNPAHVPRWIEDLNRIFGAQANILFTPLPTKEPPVDTYTGGSSVYETTEEWSKEVGHHRDSGADTNVFLVGKWKGMGNDRYKDVLGTYVIATKDIVCDDRDSHDAFMTTLAHELGHFLAHRRNLNYGHPGKKNSLFITVNWKNGVKIPRQLVNDFNPRNDGPKVR